ncbi:hypothetical protein QR680_012549 [Steinernema hermaphroditum]|uniref:Major sperm protein n=1 Tax=Steinernema hermaphroditum TaxID=289476 RepID=A0AA39M0X5_9BILA|nr:hypothetical protein QR680_012549 [Steinernema hermaphroditum]
MGGQRVCSRPALTVSTEATATSFSPPSALILFFSSKTNFFVTSASSHLPRPPSVLHTSRPLQRLLCRQTRLQTAASFRASFSSPARPKMVIALDPSTCQVPASGGNSLHQIVNQGASRLAFKVKSSNNAQYRIKAVYGFVSEGARTPIEVIRHPGPPKEDKLVVQFAEVPPEETDPRAPFLAGAAQGEVIMTLSAV